MRRLLVAALLLVLAVSVPARAADSGVTIAQYLADWSRLDAAAINREVAETGTFDPERHPDFARVIGQMRHIALAYRERIKAERAAGTSPHSCLPDREAEITTDVLMNHLRSYAPSQRDVMSLDDAFAELMAKTYPCSWSLFRTRPAPGAPAGIASAQSV